MPVSHLAAEDQAALRERVADLERQLEEARAGLREAQDRVLENEARLEAVAEEAAPAKIAIGPFRIGGAIRANYTVGDYGQVPSTSATRGGTGAFSLDTFRLNVDYEDGSWIGKGEYRFYPGYAANNTDSYHFPHTLWVGYNFEGGDQVQVGLNRTPFGPGPYGVSQSWLFDQHYYVGLSDNMNIGVKYTTATPEWTFDFAYYVSSAPNGGGNNFGRRSARYSYDVVDETGDGYEERHQFNVRGVYSTVINEVDTDLGGSLQYGNLKSNGPQSNGDMYAASLHMVNKWNNWTLASQLTYYEYNVHYINAANPALANKLVTMGAYDFPTEVAAKAWVPAVSVSYYHEVPELFWLDYVIPYLEYSSIVKRTSGFNDSQMVVLGTAWARGGWYIYTDLAFSNGNDFVGNRDVSPSAAGIGGFTSQFGENSNSTWMTRFNINFGYYF